MQPGEARQGGMTLLELTLVLFLLGILISIAIPNFSRMTEPSLQQEGKRIAKLITGLRQEAVTTGAQFRLVFDSSRHEIAVEYLVPGSLEDYKPHPRFEEPLGLQSGIRFRNFDNQVQEASRFGFQPIRFESLFGDQFRIIIDSAGLVDICQIELAEGNRWLTVKVKTLMGKIEITPIQEGL